MLNCRITMTLGEAEKQLEAAKRDCCSELVIEYWTGVRDTCWYLLSQTPKDEFNSVGANWK